MVKMKYLLKILIFMCISASVLADEIKHIPNKFIGTWADSIRTCRTKEPIGDYMLLVKIKPTKLEGQYVESSFTFTPIQIESHGINSSILNTVGKMAPYYDEDGGDQQQPTFENIVLFLKNGGLYILPQSENKLIKCS